MSLAHLAPIFTQYITCMSVLKQRAMVLAVNINTIKKTHHIQLHTLNRTY